MDEGAWFVTWTSSIDSTWFVICSDDIVLLDASRF